jgi:hypothetical protein
MDIIPGIIHGITHAVIAMVTMIGIMEVPMQPTPTMAPEDQFTVQMEEEIRQIRVIQRMFQGPSQIPAAEMKLHQPIQGPTLHLHQEMCKPRPGVFHPARNNINTHGQQPTNREPTSEQTQRPRSSLVPSNQRHDIPGQKMSVLHNVQDLHKAIHPQHTGNPNQARNI